MNGPFVTYFPQFCSEPINDSAWYRGFNDWHLIEKLPASMRARFTPAAGYYDLGREPDIGAQLSSLRGSDWPAMALYQYYFDGRFALNAVEKFVLTSNAPIPPFFVIWANESWTKRWIGRPNDYIIEQRHSLEPDVISTHCDRLAQLFDHPAYQKWEGRPVFVLYSVFDVPNVADLIAVYRVALRARGWDPLIGFCVPYVDSRFSAKGFDFCVEFQPRLFFNVMRLQATPTAAKSGLWLKRSVPALYESLLSVRDRWARMRNTPRESFDYSAYLDLVERETFTNALRETYGVPTVPCLFYSWNNFPRYRGGAVVVRHEKGDYARFLALKEKWRTTHRWYLVNSWNEWSEGAALEPGQCAPELYDQVLGAQDD